MTKFLDNLILFLCDTWTIWFAIAIILIVLLSSCEKCYDCIVIKEVTVGNAMPVNISSYEHLCGDIPINDTVFNETTRIITNYVCE